MISRYAAFTEDPAGGNPAGVVLDASEFDDAAMLRIAAELGYSETAFVTGRPEGAYRVRYFSPLTEIPFCGHATVATAVALGPGDHLFRTNAGDVPVTVDDAGVATLISVAPSVRPLDHLTELLAALGWPAGDLDPALPPRVAYAGAHHPIVAVTSRKRLAGLDYDVPALKSLMTERDWTTIQLVFRAGEDTFDVRNPFPVGGVYEDPATGAAAAALGGYLRELGLVPDDATLLLRQGDDLGRPSRITVRLVPGEPGVRVSGAAVPMP
ncbi:PhzF family phenazine biosynthesis isomerase [Actinoplanes sp. NPDC051851]|uniref:PhzF family phenazine biosynthesis protein n=1 Tax=Actinoplanes sp. NPDC051851 TaxID=3154753 RepID=UPI0034210AE1